MTLGHIQTLRVPITLNYLAPADFASVPVNIGGEFAPAFFDLLTSTIVDVSGKNSVRKTVVVITGREII